MKFKPLSAILLAMTLGVGALVTAAPAQAAASVTSVSNGTLVAKGVAVTGTYTVECQFFGENISVHMDLRQRAGGKTVTSSSFSDSFECEGNGVPVTRTYTFGSSSTAFKSGAATVTGRIFSHTCCVFTSEPIFQEISLSK